MKGQHHVGEFTCFVKLEKFSIIFYVNVFCIPKLVPVGLCMTNYFQRAIIVVVWIVKNLYLTFWIFIYE